MISPSVCWWPDGEVMLAYAMNGEQLPMLNGLPLRLLPDPACYRARNAIFGVGAALHDSGD
jgi:hypothetical protein